MPSGVNETAARIRAARGYSGMTQKALAEALGHSVETMSRIENARREATSKEVEKISEICKVPMEFMDTGFELIIERSGQETQRQTLNKVARIEDEIKLIRAFQQQVVGVLARDGSLSADSALLEQELAGAVQALRTSEEPAVPGTASLDRPGPGTGDDAG